VTDDLNFRVQSNVASDVLVYSVHLLLTAGPAQGTTQTPAVENFTIIVLPDTQHYSASYPDIFDNQTRWIVGEAENMNVVFVTHEGDIVDSDVLVQWQNANRSMSLLHDHVPWGVLPGNHDGAASGGSLADYDEFFGCARFSGESWYGGGYLGSNANNYEFFSGGGDDYLIFHFQYNPSDAVLAWANETIEGFPNRKVIVTTHDYLRTGGDRSSIGENIWSKFIEPHADQIFLVLCGHAHGEARRTDTVGGHVVYQLLADYQSRTNGGNGFLRILKFSPAEDKIHVATYSPYLNSYETDSDSEFELGFDMTGILRESPLLLNAEPNQASYMTGQSVTLTVSVFNQLNPPLESTLTLTVTGPNNYYYFDFQPISISADTVGEHSFTLIVPDVSGTYVVEVELVPPRLTAYDAVWLQAT
jgi:hypothetical protein